MKKLLPLIIIACIAPASCGDDATTNEKVEKSSLNDWQKERLSGKVNSVRQRVYWALEKFGRIEKGKLQNMPAQDYLKIYDDEGYLIEETHYDASDKVVSRNVISYGPTHLITLEEIYKETALSERIVYTYDDNNRLVKKEKFDGEGKIKEWMQYIYGKNSLVEDEDWYKADGNLNCKYIHKYDNILRLVEKEKYWGGGSLAQKEYYYYEDNNKDSRWSEIVSEKYKNKESSFDYRFVFKNYNSYNDFGEKIQYNEDGEDVLAIVQTFNNLGHQTEYGTIVKKNVNIPIEILPDEEDKDAAAEMGESTITTVEYNGQSYEYVYDERDNWIQKITYKVTGDDTAETKRDRQFYYERIITYK